MVGVVEALVPVTESEILFAPNGLPEVLYTAVQQQDGRSYSLGEAFAGGK